MSKISVADVARDLGIGETTVRVMAEQGLLPFMAPTNRKDDDKTRSGYVVFPNLYKLFVTGFDDPHDTTKALFLMGSAIKKEV